VPGVPAANVRDDTAQERRMPDNILGLSLTGPGHYVTVGTIQISVANLVVIGLMLVVFVLAIILPFPKDRR
jgi:hypothetical protein